jgi:hypothetical protein
MINAGTVLGQRYRLEERTASGGMGDVCAASTRFLAVLSR